MSHQEALERIAFREECINSEAEELRQIARKALGWTDTTDPLQGEKGAGQ